MSKRIGMVAGEPSGDLLAGRIIAGLQAGDASVRCEGIGGPQMQARDFNAWHPMHALTVFGYVDALKRLPSLLSTYRDVKRRWLAEPPAVFVGIDAPDFNLRLEHQLRQAGTPTVHFVGPSIWAWRYERIHKIRESVSHMLVLFPFEEEIYRKEGIPVTYVGHPLAGAVPMQPDRAAARAGHRPERPRAGDPARQPLVGNPPVGATLPAGRADPAKARSGVAVHRAHGQRTAACGVPVLPRAVPGAWPALRHGAGPAWRRRRTAGAGRLVGHGGQHRGAGGQRHRHAGDGAGKRPMVISYVLSPWMRRIMAWKSGQERPYLPWVGLPNVLLRDFAVPELLQDDATPEKLAEATWTALTDEALGARIEARFTALHQDLLRDTPALAARAILEVADGAA